MAVASLVLGIVSLVFCWIPAVGFVIALVALIISIVAMCSEKLKDKQNGFKIAGLVLAIVAFIISFVITILMVSAVVLTLNNDEQIIENAQEAILQVELGDLRNALTLKYAEMLVLNMDNDYFNDVKKYNAEQIYLDILKTDYSDLYTKGYRIQVYNDLSFEIIEP